MGALLDACFGNNNYESIPSRPARDYVHHIANTSKPRYKKCKNQCKCASWKEHWLTHSDRPWPSTCCMADCDKEIGSSPDYGHGAHVQLRSVGKKWFIVPTCAKCNVTFNDGEIDYATHAVPVVI